MKKIIVASGTVVNYIVKYSYIWLLIFSCIVIATVKITMINWSHQYLSEFWKIPPETNSYWLFIGMLLGFLVAGWCSDKFFCGMRWKTNVLFHFGMFFLLLVFWLIPANIAVLWYSYLMHGICFFIYGIQALIFLQLLSYRIKRHAALLQDLLCY